MSEDKVKLTKEEKAIVRLHKAEISNTRQTALMFAKYLVQNQDRGDIFHAYMEEHCPEVIEQIEKTIAEIMQDKLVEMLKDLYSKEK